MATEGIQVRVRRKLEEAFGVDEATYLMDRPPGGWSDLVTRDYLDARLETLEHKLIGVVDRRLRAQTWITTTAMLAGLGLAFTAGRLA